MKRFLSRKWTLASAGGVTAVVLIGALFLTGVLPGATRPAHAATTSSGVCDLGAQHSVCMDNGVNASTVFSGNDGCVFTDVGVDAFQDLSQSATDWSTAKTGVFVTFYQYNTCTSTEVASAEAQVTGVDFQGDRQLNTATLNATVPLIDNYSGQPNGITLTIALTWHGVGATTTVSEDFRYRSPNGVVITRTGATARSAITVGTVTDGTTNYASAPTLYSTLFDGHGGQVVINHP